MKCDDQWNVRCNWNRRFSTLKLHFFTAKDWMAPAYIHKSCSRKNVPKMFQPGLPDFSLLQNTKTGKNIQITTNYTKCPWNLTKDRKMDQVSIKYTNIFRCKTVQNLPKFWILVWKQTIWQLWFQHECASKHTIFKTVYVLFCIQPREQSNTSVKLPYCVVSIITYVL
jgi:hypothetical protein